MNGEQQDNSFKYVMMDTGHIYLGAKYSYAELLEEDAVPFKLKTIISRYILPETKAETTLEGQFSHLENGSLLFGILQQLKIKVKVSLLLDKKSRAGRGDRRYKEKILTLKQLSQTAPEQKDADGILITEIMISRLGLMSFHV